MNNLKKMGTGISLLLFAILLQLCSIGLEMLTLGIGIVGLIISFLEAQNSKK